VRVCALTPPVVTFRFASVTLLFYANIFKQRQPNFYATTPLDDLPGNLKDVYRVRGAPT
jgi:hypothetical protein